MTCAVEEKSGEERGHDWHEQWRVLVLHLCLGRLCAASWRLMTGFRGGNGLGGL